MILQKSLHADLVLYYYYYYHLFITIINVEKLLLLDIFVETKIDK